MKKIALTSLLAVFAASGANAANVIDGNPLYRPGEGRAYSVTSVFSDSKDSTFVGLSEEMGYSFTKRLMAVVKTTADQSDWFKTSAWDDFGIALDYRILDDDAFKADIFGGYTVNEVWPYHHAFLDDDATYYKWTVGVRAGFIDNVCGWTLAAHAAYDYLNTESFNWDDKGLHQFRLGVDGQVVLNREWSLVGGVEYTSNTDDWSKKPGVWAGTVGANYNIDETKFVGGYIGKEMTHVASGDWEVADGFMFGAKFGIDF